MPELIEVLREEHRNIEKLLLVLEREFDVFGRREQPDYEVVHAVTGYFNGSAVRQGDGGKVPVAARLHLAMGAGGRGGTGLNEPIED
jgi:hypothetical protein